MKQETFISAWQRAESITHASVMLQKAGYAYMTPRRTLEWARCLRKLGVNLKKIPRPTMPAFTGTMEVEKKESEDQRIRRGILGLAHILTNYCIGMGERIAIASIQRQLLFIGP